MTLFLFITAIIGLLIFFISYLRIVLSSFQHHTVTGFISIFPGINLTVLPTVWGQMSNAFLLSIVGLGVSLGAWYGGGNQHLILNPITSVEQPTVNQPVNSSTKEIVNLPIIHKTKETALPQKPLYYVVFKQVEVNALGSLVNQYIRVKLIDDRVLEGRNIKVNDSSLLLETYDKGNIQLVKIAAKHIKTLEKLVDPKE
jgi:hypothetical protein